MVWSLVFGVASEPGQSLTCRYKRDEADKPLACRDGTLPRRAPACKPGVWQRSPKR